MIFLRVIFYQLLFASAMLAQDASFEILVSQDTVLLDNYLEVKFVIEQAQGDFEPPTFEGFQIVSGPNQSSQMSIINGEVSQQRSYGYYLAPVQPGDLYIGEAYLTLNDQVLETAPKKIIALDNPDQIQSSPQAIGRQSFRSSKSAKPSDEEQRPKKKYKTRKI